MHKKMLNIPPLLVAFFTTFIGNSFAKDATSPISQVPSSKAISHLLNDASLVSTQGREIEVIGFDALNAHRQVVEPSFRFLIQGGLHGNETQTTQFVTWLALRYARGESLLNKFAEEHVGFDFLPIANPDGFQENQRFNNQGVNLNRNFGVLWGVTKENPGKSTFSESETKAIKALFAKRRYTAAVDVHGYINWIVAPSEPSAVAKGGFKPSLQRMADYLKWTSNLKEEMRVLTGYQLKTGAGLGDGGAFEDWAFWSEGAFAFCLEMETFQRYVPSYRGDYSNRGTEVKAATHIDLFRRYEAFIARMFAKSIELKKNRPFSNEAPQVSSVTNWPR